MGVLLTKQTGVYAPCFGANLGYLKARRRLIRFLKAPRRWTSVRKKIMRLTNLSPISCARRALPIFTFAAFTILDFNTSADTRDINAPNEFWFTSDVYYVEGASNAVITVEFHPGNRSWSGTVDYYTSDGTATAGEDYTAVSGTLSFSGPGTPIPQIIIPIAQVERTEDETVQIFLSNPNATITRGTATLIIQKKTPALKITPGTNGTIVLSWPEEGSNLSLQKSSSLFGSDWTPVPAPQSVVNGSCKVIEPASGGATFYRLEKTSQP